MPSHIDIRGASGAFYRFRPADDPRARSTMSGNYVYVRGEELVFLGETDNLMIGAADRWQEASASYGADGIYIRPIVARATRVTGRPGSPDPFHVCARRGRFSPARRSD